MTSSDDSEEELLERIAALEEGNKRLRAKLWWYEGPHTPPSKQQSSADESLSSLSSSSEDNDDSHSSKRHRVRAGLERGEVGITRWFASHSIEFLRGGLGVVFLWFGVLKFVPGLSPAQHLAVGTIHILTGSLLPPAVSRVGLAIVECTIGIGFLSGRFMRVTLLLMAFQMVGTFTPLILFPGTVFAGAPYALTLEGQYIVKNLVLIGGGMGVAATLHGGASLLPRTRMGVLKARSTIKITRSSYN